MPRSSIFASICIALFLTSPGVAYGDAGFPADAIWLSSSAVTAGNTVSIYTVLFNSSDGNVTGKLTFFVDDKVLEARQFTLSAGSSKIESAEWRSRAGDHTIVASISEASLPAANTRTGTIKIFVADPPPPSAIEEAVQKVGTVAARTASVSIPIIESTAQAVYGHTEAFREKGLAYAEKLSAQQNSSAGGASSASAGGKTLGTSKATPTATSGLPAQAGGTVSGFEPQENKSMFSKFSQLAAPILAFTFGSKKAFYAILCIVALITLYVLSRIFMRERRSNKSRL